jgi:uncharacterized protein (TIGR00251 family)
LKKKTAAWKIGGEGDRRDKGGVLIAPFRFLETYMDNPAVQEVDGGVVFAVKVVPGSSRTAVCGLLGDMVKVKVAAAPERGKANRRLVEHLAKQLSVKKGSISIISGQTSPVKQVRVSGISARMLLERLNATSA